MPIAPLPVDGVLPALAAALAPSGANAVLTAPPGAGKTTRVPPALLAAGLAGDKKIVMLEPRRIAARAAARRIAEEQGWEVGEEVGYQIRFERRAGPRTRIVVVTEGILLQQLQSDPFLEDVGVVIFDEFHERSLQVDLSLALARRVQREVRDDLRLLAMSATLDAEVTGRLAEFLGGCAVLDSPGRLFPVAVTHLEPTAPAVPGKERTPAETARRAAFGIRRALAESGGDLLVFLPGVGEIQRTAEALAPLDDLAVLPLYGDLPAEQQDLVLRPASRRKVVLATNVAETSITVDGVTAVVDTGLARRLRWDPATGLDRLELARISRASATQRAGRAGRQAPGICLRLWPEREHATLPERELPEIARVDLAAPALQLYAWGERDLEAFDWFEAPDPLALAAAGRLLGRLGAVDGQGITALGRTMSRLPIHPRLARLLIAGAELGVVREAALLAALLSERDPFARERRPAQASRSDLLDRLDLLEGSPAAARSIFRVRDQLLHLTRDLATGSLPADRDSALLQSLLAAYPDRLVRRREPGSRRGVMLGGKGVRLGEESNVLDPELFLAIDLDAGAPGEARVRLASAVEPAWLDPAHLQTAVELEFDGDRERVGAWKRTRWEDLLLSEAEVPPPSGEQVERVLAAAAAERLERALPLDDPEVAVFLARLRSLAGWCPELELPSFPEEEIRELLPVLATGRKSFAELRRAPLLDVLRGALSWPQREALDREAPERLTVPSGSALRLTYEPGKPPVLAVRIQELFGLAETPRIAKGRVPVLLHLLAPSGRPQQVTHDLKSFWDNTYPQVRKELAGRYPKHAWPLDPWNATPQRKGRPPGN